MMYNEETWKQELLQEGPYREARAWLAEGVGTLGEDYTQEGSRKLVDEIYAAGAVSVTALDIDLDPDDDYENSGRLLVELDHDPIHRKQVIDRCNRLACKLGFDHDTDHGQRYLFVMLD